MSYHKGAQCGGVRTLANIQGRCVIDIETGCWRWRGAMSQGANKAVPSTRCWLPSDVAGAAQVMTAHRAAWLLAGNPLPAGHVVWRHICTAGDCINPDHGRSGTRKQMGAAIADTGRNKGCPVRTAINLRNRESTLTPAAVVRQAETMFADGMSGVAIRRALGLGNRTVAMIRDGMHPNSAGRTAAIPQSSVFSWGLAA